MKYSQNKMKNVLMYSAICLTTTAIAQTQSPTLQVTDTIHKTIQLDEVLVSAVRATEKHPVAFSNLSKNEIRNKNNGQQLPMLLNHLPSVVTYSEDGSGLGTTKMYVRGTDLERTNVTINGIPLNDSESQAVFFYNLSDFASSAENIQLQRGVGTSSNGAGAFGASLNILTDAVQEKATGELANYYGSYNTHKHSLKISTGKINDRFELNGRFSVIKSDGYRDRASSDLKSYFLQGAYAYGNTLIKALVFGGKQKVYLTYQGIDKQTLERDRRLNPVGAYTDDAGNKRFYDDETDNYQQDHAQLHWTQRWSPNWKTQLSFHYTKGKGYWQEYKEAKKYSKFGLPKVLDGSGNEKKTDGVIQQGLDNDFWGTTFSANYNKENIHILLGGAMNRYEGRHQKYLLWTRSVNAPLNYRYSYEGPNTKNEMAAYAKLNYDLNSQWDIFVDVQFRRTHYPSEKQKVDEGINAFNPKVGVTYHLNDYSHLYLSYGKATKEPNRSDYKDYNEALEKDPNAKRPLPEKLNDLELGWRFACERMSLNLNAYYMSYIDQLVLTGKLNDTGYPIRENVDNSHRAGIELDAQLKLSDKWQWQPNLALSSNKIKKYQNIREGKVVNLENVQLSYSPNVIAGSRLTFEPIKGFAASWEAKYVGKQYVDNTERDEAKLDAYFVNNLQLQYELTPHKWCRSVLFSVAANNFLNAKYAPYGDNGYGMVYIPAAEANFLGGITIGF